MEMPLSTFEGWLKQVDVGNLNDLARRAMDIAFPGFRVLKEPTQEMRSMMEKHVELGADYVTWLDRPYRRYAGSANLPRGRYSTTVAQGPSGNDNGTLFRELLAYSDPRKSGLLMLVDLGTDKGVAMLNQIATGVEKMDAFAILFVGRPGAPNAFIGSLSEEERAMGGVGNQKEDRVVVPVVIPYKTEPVHIERAVDLRVPQVQEWFFQVFGAADTDFYVKLDRADSSRFLDLLWTLLWPDLGGHDFTNSVGRWLRTKGVQSLVYPSARSNCGIMVESGGLTSSYGWNLVDYSDSPIPDEFVQQYFDMTPGWPKPFAPGIHLSVADDDKYRGSWRVKGLEEWYQRVLNQREQEFLQMAHG